MREFPFEMRLCARLESEGHLVSRQLGASIAGKRVIDTLLVEPGPQFDARTRITPHSIPVRAIESDIGVGRARRPARAFDCSPQHARSVAERAAAVGFFEAERRGGQRRYRQTARYPDWFGSLTGIENKPDLGRPGELELQLRKDVSLSLLDEIILCTESYVTGAHLNRIPDEVGVWRFDPETGDREVIREPAPLAPGEPGIEVLEEHPGHTEIRPVTVAEKRTARLKLAERAYGKGWRVPLACPHGEYREIHGVGGVAYCPTRDRVVHPSEACAPGDPPETDLDSFRAAHSQWVRDPAGVARTQSGLDRFGE
ncbi:DUF5787 family protein [Natronomonas sp. EA1]|uniref:DUF5787 family protein n=1 Tax=Natronomonas sp. EA1 TaxID=3421655 RepID=UPI003EBB6211